MMMDCAVPPRVYVGNARTRILLQTDADLDCAQGFEIVVQRPDGSTMTWPATRDGASSVIYYDTDASTLDQAGPWVLQARLLFGPGEHIDGASTVLMVRAAFG